MSKLKRLVIMLLITLVVIGGSLGAFIIYDMDISNKSYMMTLDALGGGTKSIWITFWVCIIIATGGFITMTTMISKTRRINHE